ncbi:hypothetical protein LINPERPRIM_LOCUS77, partial [Linum perenne]
MGEDARSAATTTRRRRKLGTSRWHSEGGRTTCKERPHSEEDGGG